MITRPTCLSKRRTRTRTVQIPTMMSTSKRRNDADDVVIMIKRWSLIQDSKTHEEENIKLLYGEILTRSREIMRVIERGESSLNRKLKTERK